MRGKSHLKKSPQHRLCLMDRSEAGKKGFEKTGHLLDAFREEKSRQARAEYEANPKFCLSCQKMLPFEKRRSNFCDQSCSASYNNRGVTRHLKGSKVCSCGKPKLPQNKYCAECIEKGVFRKKVTVASTKDDKTRRRMLIEIRGVRCESCGLVEWMGQPIPLEMHHLDGDTDNNLESNLQLLCPNCHALTGTHKRRNKNGRRQQQRRQRYAEGKTW